MDHKVTITETIEGELVPGRREARACVIAAGLTDADIDRLIKDALEKNLSLAEENLLKANAQFARELGIPLCNCTFPPQIMLWKEQTKLHVCPNPECGHTHSKGMRISQELRDRAKNPPHTQGWMRL